MAHGTWSAAWPDCAPQMRHWGYRAYAPAYLRTGRLACPSVAARHPHPLPLIVPCVACAARGLACRHLSCACSMHSGCQILDRCSQWQHWSTVGSKVSTTVISTVASNVCTNNVPYIQVSFLHPGFLCHPGFFRVCGFCLFEWKKRIPKKIGAKIT